MNCQIETHFDQYKQAVSITFLTANLIYIIPSGVRNTGTGVSLLKQTTNGSIAKAVF